MPAMQDLRCPCSQRVTSLAFTLAAVAASAAVWELSCFLNNSLLFGWAEVKAYRHLVFFPSGIKLVLAMVLGWRGALGVALCSYVDLGSSLPSLSGVEIAPLALGLGFGPLIAVRLFQHFTAIRPPWYGLRAHHLPVLSLINAVSCGLPFQGLLVALRVEESDEFLPGLVTMVTGDFLGAGILLVAVGGAAKLVRMLQRAGGSSC